MGDSADYRRQDGLKGYNMERTKVIEFIHSMEDGGAETLVKDYVRLIDKEKFDVVVVITREYKPTANLRILKEEGARIIKLYPCWNVFTKLWHETMGRWYVPFRLRKIIREERAQVMHVHLEMLKYVRRIGRALEGIRLFFTCHNLPIRCIGANNIEEKRAAEYLIRHHDLRLIALHRDMATELNEMFGVDNTVVIRNGIDFTRFRGNTITKQEKRSELGIPQDAFVMGHVGRFAKQKNHSFLAEVFIMVSKRKKNAFLLMVGARSAKEIEDKLKQNGLSNRYMILSHRSDVHEIMRAMDVFVFPSLFEGLGNVMIEAQVSGLRCIASDAVPEEAFKTETAISLPLGNAEKWADVILDESIRSDCRGSLDEYDMNKEIRRLEKLYAGEWDEA